LLATDDGAGSTSSNTAVPAVTEATGVTETSDAGGQPTETSAATAVTDPATSGAPATTTAPVTVAPTAAPTTSAAELIVDPTNPVRWAEYTGGKVYLQGSVPDQATSDELRDKAAGVVGPDNVLVQYVIDPAAARPNSAPLFVRDSVLFQPSGVAIDDTARAVLDLGLALMNQNPAVTIDINGYSDGEGDDAQNLSLSQQRVDAIFNYLVFNGIDPVRLTRTAHGEADPVADNATAEGRAKNRRVEFTVNNLLG
jgi:outer membrane protein OmpA-like peptidoglycan-associated protein